MPRYKDIRDFRNLGCLKWFIGAVSLQIILGILTILSYVKIVVALLHQAGAIALFALAIYFIHRFRALDAENR